MTRKELVGRIVVGQAYVYRRSGGTVIVTGFCPAPRAVSQDLVRFRHADAPPEQGDAGVCSQAAFLLAFQPAVAVAEAQAAPAASAAPEKAAGKVTAGNPW